MNISSSKSPYLLQIERSNRPKATFGNRFRIALDSEKAESKVSETAEEEEATKEYKEEDPNESYALPAEEEDKDEFPYSIEDEEAEYFLEKYGEKFNDSDPSKLLDELDETKDNVDPLQAMEEMTGKISAPKPSYTITDEEAEYFREKYGEEYNKENRFKLFSELANKNIISKEDADVASRKNTIGIIIGGPSPEYVERMIAKYGYCTWGNAKVVWNNVEYGDSYEKYKKQNDMPINTWQDYVQDNYNYYRYIRDTDDVLFKADGNTFTSKDQSSFDSYCEMTLKVQNVLSQIFGEVTL